MKKCLFRKVLLNFLLCYLLKVSSSLLNSAGLQVLDYYGLKNITCPCIGFYRPVDYHCLFKAVKDNGPIESKCLQIIRELIGEAAEFQIEDLGINLNDCNIQHYFQISSGRRQEPCGPKKRKFNLVLKDRRFYDLVALNLEKALTQRQDKGSLLCGIYINRMQKKTSSQCSYSGTDKDSCRFNPSRSYNKDGSPLVGCGTSELKIIHTFEDVVFSSFVAHEEQEHIKTYFARKPELYENDTEDAYTNTTSIKMTYVISNLNIDLIRIGMSCSWEMTKTKREQSESTISLLNSVQGVRRPDSYSGGIPVQSNFELIFRKVFRLKKSDGDIFSDGDPNLRLSLLRVYPGSTFQYGLHWDCPDSFSKQKEKIKLLCFFGFSINIPTNLSLTDMHSWAFGPLITVELPLTQNKVLVEIQTGFENRTFEGILQPLNSRSSVIHMFKYDFFRGKYAKYGDYQHKKSHDREEYYSNDYFEQSILLPGTFNPTVLTTNEVNNLNIQCQAQVQSEDGAAKSSWSKAVHFNLLNAVQPMKLIATEGMGKPGSAMSSRNLVRYDGQQFSQKKIGAVSLVDSTFSSITYIKSASQKICDNEAVFESTLTSVASFSKNCGHKWDRLAIQTEYNMRRIGCYHWMFNRWYVFHENVNSNTCELVYHEGETGELYWHEIAWKRFDPAPKTFGFPTDMRCANLHSFLIWSEYDVNMQLQFMKIMLDTISGDVVSKPEKIEHTDFCTCANSAVDVSIPIFDLVYPDLTKPGLVEIAALCKQNISSSTIEASLHSITFSSSRCLNKNLLEDQVKWFAVDQWHIYYITKDSRNSTSVLNYGTEPGNRTQRIYSKLNYYSVYSSKNEHNVPVAPLHCLKPIIKSQFNRFKMLTSSAGQVLIATRRNESQECQSFAKLRFVYKIEFALVPNPLEQKSIDEMECRPRDFPEEGNLECKAKIAKTKNETMLYVLGNLIPNAKYFIQVTVSLDMDSMNKWYSLKEKWYAGTKWPTAKLIGNTTYVPVLSSSGYSLNFILGVSIPIIIVIIMLWLTLWLWYRRRTHIYQYLARLSKSDIHREDKLAEGSFGEVWKARIGRQTVVVKTLKESANEREEKEFRDEALLISKFQCDYIIKTMGICLQSRPIMLELEYANGGALDLYLRDIDVRLMIRSIDLLQITKDIASACMYLETAGFVHRDIAARNCLIFLQNDISSKPKIAKLSDFGLAKDTGKDTIYKVQNIDSDTVPVAWTAPEGFFGTFSSKSDIWSFGVLMWEIFSFGSVPYGNCIANTPHNCRAIIPWTHEEIEFRVCVPKKTLVDFGDPCFSIFCVTLKTIMAECWKFNPAERPSFKHLHKYLRGAQSDIERLYTPDFSVYSGAPQNSDFAVLKKTSFKQAYTYNETRKNKSGREHGESVAGIECQETGIEMVQHDPIDYMKQLNEDSLSAKNSALINLVPVYSHTVM